jgi:hypothetical protein
MFDTVKTRLFFFSSSPLFFFFLLLFLLLLIFLYVFLLLIILLVLLLPNFLLLFLPSPSWFSSIPLRLVSIGMRHHSCSVTPACFHSCRAHLPEVSHLNDAVTLLWLGWPACGMCWALSSERPLGILMCSLCVI